MTLTAFAECAVMESFSWLIVVYILQGALASQTCKADFLVEEVG